MKNQKAAFSQNAPIKITTPSFKFFKPTLATTLAIVLASLLSVRPAQAGYTVTLQQVGPNVVATGSGAIDLTGLTFSGSTSLDPAIRPAIAPFGNRTLSAFINTGPTSSSVDIYVGASGPGTGFGTLVFTSASSGSGDMVGIIVGGTSLFGGFPLGNRLSVPKDYVSGTTLSDMAVYSGTTLASLGATPGTYVWTWGAGANQNFTLKILSAILPAAKTINSSTRAVVQAGQSAPIAGFIVSGGGKTVVVRGLGPTLHQSGFLGGVLADPFVSLFDRAGNLLQTNDNWRDSQQAEIQATGLAPPNDLESAILRTLQPGNYTAVLSGKGGTLPRLGLVEVYDANTGALAELTNVSTRGFVGTGSAVIIAGFISNGSTQVVVRGLGPTLAQFGVSQPLADPVVSLFDGNGNLVSRNNNWRDKQQAAIQATGLAPPNELEAAILAPVSAGNYTAILEGNGGGTGIGLVEVYKL
jgi:hypothetical protein